MHPQNSYIDKKMHVWKNTCHTADKGSIAILCKKFSQIANKLTSHPI